MPSLPRLPFLIAALILLAFPPAYAAPLIRDAEIEHTLRAYGDPIFRAAGLEPDSVRIFIVQDDSINAFVAGGPNLFLHTGLIKATRDPGMLLGVMAHETGHIAGGHLARGTEQLKNAQMGVLLGYVLGAAAAAAGGGDAGIAVMAGGQNAFMRNFLSFTRSNEQAADQAAVGYLDQLNISSTGMLAMFELLRRQEQRQFGTPDPYTLTHPLSLERITHLRAHTEESPIPANRYPHEFEAMHQRMLAKLYGFLDPPQRTLSRYPLSDKSLPARMARAIAWYKIPDIGKAAAEMEALVRENPDDAFLLELQGQILFENGRIAPALTAYEKAAKRMPDSPLILMALASAQLAEGSNGNLRKALAGLERATQAAPDNPNAWRLLATAYGKTGNDAMSHLALAEEAALEFEPELCKAQAEQALLKLPAGAPARLRAEDLKRLSAELRERKKELR